MFDDDRGRRDALFEGAVSIGILNVLQWILPFLQPLCAMQQGHPSKIWRNLHTFRPEMLTYINLCFRNSFLKVTWQMHKTFFLELIFRKLPYIDLHVFVCDSENNTEKLGLIFMENLISVAQKNVIGIDFCVLNMAQQNYCSIQNYYP